MEKTLTRIPKMLTDQQSTAKIKQQKGLWVSNVPVRLPVYRRNYPTVLLPPQEHGYIKGRDNDCL